MTENTGGAAGDDFPVVVREARPDDADAVAAFTQDTWGERHEDYIPRVFPEWAESDDPDRGTFVATLPPKAIAGHDAVRETGDREAVVGCIQGALLTEWEAWGQGIRVDPAARGFGVGTALSNAALDWAREHGATVCRNMVFSWNIAGLGQSRAVGFEPATEFRFAEPDPDAATTTETATTVEAATAAADRSVPAPIADPDPNAAWAFWVDSDTRDHLCGLALDPDESWACSELTRDRLAVAADEGRLLAVAGDTLAGFAVRTRVSERTSDEGPVRTAEYGVAAWRDADAAGALYQSIAADAAAAGSDATRVLIPETVEHVSDTGANRVPVAAEPDFVMSADLTGGSGGKDAAADSE